MEAKHVMQRSVGTIPADTPLLDAVQAMKNRCALIVFKGDEPCGIVTRDDLVHGVIAAGKPTNETVHEVMATRLADCQDDTALSQVRSLISDDNVDHLLVFDSEERLVGLVSENDIC